MSNEKLVILKMLEEKKITAEEAAKLLEAATDNVPVSNDPPKNSSRIYGNVEPEKVTKHEAFPESARFKEIKTNETFKEMSNFNTEQKTDSNNFNTNHDFDNTNQEQKFKKNTYKSKQGTDQSFDDFARDITNKFEQFAKKMEPKLKKMTEVVVERTASAADSMSKSLHNYSQSRAEAPIKKKPEQKPVSKPPQPASKPPQPSSRYNTSEKSFEIKINQDNNQLNITSLNGDISIRGYNGDKISGKVFYKSQKGSSDIDFIKLGNKYLLNYNREDFDSVSIDIFIPEKLFSSILVEGNDGKVEISTIDCMYFVVSNRTGKSFISDIKASNIKVDCNNNVLQMSNILSEEALIENYNGEIIFSNLNIKKLKVDAFNSNINLSMESFKQFDEYLWEVESSNGKIFFNMPLDRELGYYVNARTTLSKVKVSLLGLEYLSDTENFVEARTSGYDTMANHVLLRLETSNAPLVIN